MSKAQNNFILKVHKLIDLVVAPSQDPFSDYEPARSGESALLRAIRQWEATGRWDFSFIMIHIPNKKFDEIDCTQISQQFTHYLKGQLAENKEQLYLFKLNLLRILKNAFLFLTLCMVLVSIFANPSFMPSIPPILRKVLTEGFTVIGWVVLWLPVELIINTLGQLRQKNKIYLKLLNAPIRFIPDDSF